MRISELITKLEVLKNEHGDIEALVDGYEDGYDPIKGLMKSHLYDQGYDDDTNWWSGKYDGYESEYDSDGSDCVVISR